MRSWGDVCDLCDSTDDVVGGKSIIPAPRVGEATWNSRREEVKRLRVLRIKLHRESDRAVLFSGVECRRHKRGDGQITTPTDGVEVVEVVLPLSYVRRKRWDA